MIKAVFFDLDGTLLPMDNDVFTKTYFKLLVKRMIPYGYEPQQMIDGIWGATYAMVKNDGTRLNSEVFWERFAEIMGSEVLEREADFNDFYENEFKDAKEVCGYNETAVKVVEFLKEKGVTLVLATNPIFPAIATEQRIEWAGLKKEDFAIVTTYESIGLSKPNPAYYKALAEQIGVDPKDCIMVGNDVEEDMVAGTIGMDTYLLTDNLLNKKDLPIAEYKQGSFEDLLEFFKENL